MVTHWLTSGNLPFVQPAQRCSPLYRPLTLRGRQRDKFAWGTGEFSAASPMKSLLCLFQALLATMLLAGCSGHRPAPAAFNEPKIQPYRLGPRDRVRIPVFAQDSLTNTYA